ASKTHDKRQRFAEDHAAALAAKLSKIVIRIDTANRAEGLEITRDATTVVLAELGTAVPVDPGAHTIEARPPGYVAWSTTVTVPSTPGTIEAVVPALKKLPDPGPGRQQRRGLAYSIGAGGIVLIGASLILGAEARSSWREAQANCFERSCNQAGLDQAHNA